MNRSVIKVIDAIPIDDLFGLCLADLVREPLLTAEQEVRLACQGRGGEWRLQVTLEGCVRC